MDGRAVLYAAESAQVLTLNQTASDVWWLLDGELELPELVAVLAQAYSTTPDTIEADVRAVLSTFADAGLIAPVDCS